ncbi:MAG: beta-lactamase family protein, partial [Chloroflexi bacterium]|nr:beta-lactamase family protein [Chloroflexota bacterium]
MAGAPVADASIAGTVNRIATQYLAETPIVGLSVTVARDGRIVHDAAYGYARRSPDVPTDSAVPFELFSLDQPVTAVLLLRLADRDLIDLDAAAGTAVRDLQGSYASATLRQLLRHSSGNLELVIEEQNPERQDAQPASREELLAMLGAGVSAAAADEHWLYSAAGYVVASLAAEEVTQQPLDALLREEIAGPLGLAHFASCADLAGRHAQGYRTADGVTQPVPAIGHGGIAESGSVCGTTGDMARWWLAVRSGQVISPASLQEWMAPLTLARNGVRAEFGYGLGIRLGAYGGHTLIGDIGDGDGGSAVLAEYPDDRLLIVVASNTAGPGVPHMIEVQAAIARELLGIAETSPPATAIGPESLTTVPGL